MNFNIFKVALITAVIYVLISLTISTQFSSYKHDYQFMTRVLHETPAGPVNCKHVPRSCFNCDCHLLCGTERASLMTVKDDHYFGLPDGKYCYEASTSDCDRSHGNWVFNYTSHTWVCIPKNPAKFSGDGRKVYGYYPLTNRLVTDNAVDCGKDEHGNDLLSFAHGDIIFCGKDYCKNNFRMSDEIARYDKDKNICLCKFNGLQMISGDNKKQCLLQEIKTFPSVIEMPVLCYNYKTLVTDLKDRLYFHPSDSQKNGEIIIKNEQDIKMA